MLSDALCRAIDEVERCQTPELVPVTSKALAVMNALKHVLDSPRSTHLEHALTNLDVSALVDEEGWPEIRYTLASQKPEGGQA